MLLLVFGAASCGYSQITAWNDTSICPGDQVWLYAQSTTCTPSYLTLSDDQFSGVVNIGFPFTYYGNVYNQLLVGSNYYLSFQIALAGGYCPWSITQAVPYGTDPNTVNAIMAPWQDTNPGYVTSGASISYCTYGTAPNRVFVVSYCNVPQYSCYTNLFTGQIKLYEGSNIIETHLENRPSCAWNGDYAIHATHNITGTVADVNAGRNFPVVWTTSFEGTRWTPAGPGAYTISNIPYVASTIGNVISWYDSSGNLIATADSIQVSPSVTETYYAQVDLCSSTSTAQDSVVVTVDCTCQPPDPVWIDPTCNGGCDGSITATPQGTDSPWTINWYDATMTLVQTDAGIMGPVSYNTACAGDYTIEIIDNNACANDTTITLGEPTPVITAPMSDTIICISGTAILTGSASGGTPGYTYVWDNALVGSGPHNVSPAANTCYNVYAVDANGCAGTTEQICVNLNPPIVVTTSGNDSVCPGGSITINATSATGGDGGPYSYIWDDGTGTVGTGSSITVTPTGAPTTYCVTVTDGCETPPTTECLTIDYYGVPSVSFTSDISGGCNPITVNYTNTTNPGEVSSASWDFGNGATSSATTTATAVYATAGCYDVTLTITSPNGCVSSLTQTDMVCSYDYPIADFWASPNPTTVFESTVFFANLSTNNLTNQWFVDDSLFSFDVDPLFEFPNQSSGTYEVMLVVTNQYGCSDTTVQTIIINDDFAVYVPNAFSPDADGINDFFYVSGNDIALDEFELSIYNRWGERIYVSEDRFGVWDGTHGNELVESETYVWKLKAKQQSTGKEAEFYGHVTVVR